MHNNALVFIKKSSKKKKNYSFDVSRADREDQCSLPFSVSSSFPYFLQKVPADQLPAFSILLSRTLSLYYGESLQKKEKMPAAWTVKWYP